MSVSISTQVPETGAGQLEALGSLTPVALAIIAVIVVLTAWGVIQSYRAWAAATDELHVIERQRPALERCVDAVELRGQSDKVPKGSLLRERLVLCCDLHDRGAEADVTAVRGLTEDTLERALKLPRWVASSVVLVGLLGTLIGLVSAVTQGSFAAASPTDADVPAALRLLDRLFAGLSTAFYTTLAGIVASLLVGACIAIARGRQLAAREALERVSLRAIYPRVVISAEQALANAARSLTFIQHRLQEVLAEILNGIRQHSDAVLSRLDQHSTAVTSGLDTASRVITERMETSVELFVQHTATASEALSRLVGDSASSSVSLQELAAGVTDAAASLARASTSVADAAPLAGEHVARQVDAQTRDLSEIATRAIADAHRQHEAQRDAVIAAVRDVTDAERLAREAFVNETLKTMRAREERLFAAIDRLAGSAEVLERSATHLAKEGQGAAAPTTNGAALIDLHRSSEGTRLAIQDMSSVLREAVAQTGASSGRGRSLLARLLRR